MKKPYSVNDPDSELLCPDCGSKNVEEDTTVEVAKESGVLLKQFVCKDCKVTFIPAITSKTHKTDIDKWANKTRTHEGMNEGKSWSNHKKPECIIIRKNK